MRKLLITTAIALVALFVLAPRFVRWTLNRPKIAVGTAAARLGILRRTFVDSSTVADSNDVTAVVMDSNMGGGVIATLVAFADGKTTLYVSPGKILTSNSSENVREAAERFRTLAARHADQFGTTAEFDPPAGGHTRFYIITRTGTFANFADKTVVLQYPNQTFHALFEAGQLAAAEIQHPN